MSDSPFITDLRALLTKHGITAPAFAHGSRAFDPARPKVLYSGPVYDTEEIVAGVSALVEGKWAVAGEHTHRFEKLFSDYVGQAESVAVNSGSSADLLMIAAAKKRFGWSDGDGVIVSPVGFPTTISAVTLNGLVPVFVDIEWETLNADNGEIEKALHLYNVLTCRDHDMAHHLSPVRAILVSPVLGNPPDIDKLVELAERYGVKLLLDGCDSLGTTWRGKQLPTYFAASTCSFFPSHHISTLQGGMISSDDTELIRIARQMSQWGRACYCVGQANLLPNGVCGCRFNRWLPALPDVDVDHKYVYETDKAYNLAMPDVLGALGCAQMGKLGAIHEGRKRSYERLSGLMRHLPEVKTAAILPNASPSWFGFPFICPDYTYLKALRAHLEAAQIQTRGYFAGSITAQPGYAHLGRHEDQPNAAQVLRRVIFIGANPAWSEAHLAHIESTIASFQRPKVEGGS